MAEGGGQSLFSPDGNTYIRFNVKNKVRMFDFDRNTGALSNYRQVDVNFGTFQPFDGACGVSPSGQYLYISARRYVYQLDLYTPEIEDSQELIAEWDGYADPIATDFGRVFQGPDCKIYIGTGNGSKVMHIIHNPNEPGQACNLEQHGLSTIT